MSVIDRRKMILDAATKSFAQFGYKATTMELVAKIANVGKGTIYTFFRDKEELFEEILSNALKEMVDVIEHEIRQDDTFSQKLFRVMDLLMEFRAKHELFVKLGQENRDVGTHQAMAGLKRPEDLVLNYIRQEIDKAIQKGEVQPCDSNVVAFIMFEMYITLTVEWRRSHGPLSNEQVKEYMRLLLFKGLFQIEQ